MGLNVFSRQTTMKGLENLTIVKLAIIATNEIINGRKNDQIVLRIQT